MPTAHQQAAFDRAQAEIAQAFGGRPVPAPTPARRPAYTGRVASRRRSPDKAERASNLRRMALWVAEMRGYAEAKADPDAFLMLWHDWLGAQLDKAGGPAKGFRGLTIIDIANAQVELIAPLAVAQAQKVAA